MREAFVDPAIALLGRAAGVSIAFDHRLKGVERGGGRVAALDFGGAEPLRLAADDRVVLAVTAPVSALLCCPEVPPRPTRSGRIVNVHFLVEGRRTCPTCWGS